MTDDRLAELLERIVLAGVGLTARALAEAAPGVELTFPQWRVLLVLGEQEDGATVSEVASRIGVTVPATSRQLRRLARRGLVDVGPDQYDRRAVRARLTRAGEETREAILAYRSRRIGEEASGLRLRPTTLAELAKIADAFDRYR